MSLVDAQKGATMKGEVTRQSNLFSSHRHEESRVLKDLVDLPDGLGSALIESPVLRCILLIFHMRLVMCRTRLS